MINLRPFTDSDIPLFTEWLDKEHIRPWYSPPDDWLHEVRNRTGTFYFIKHFIAELEGIPVGFCQYYPYEKGEENWHGKIPLDGTYSIDYLIGAENYLGKGWGKLMIRRLAELVAELPQAKRIIVQPEPDNEKSVKTLLSAGFEYDKANQLYIMCL